MKGRNGLVARLSLSVLFGWVFLIDPGSAADAPHTPGRPASRGQLGAGEVVNFSELAARRETQIAKRGTRKPERGTRNAEVGTRNAAPLTSSLSTPASSELVFSAASAVPSPSPSASFLALGDNAVSFNPDTQGAVGPNHLMVTLGSEVRIQNRAGGVISTVSLDAFWGALGSSNVFDPRVLFDASAQRWITTAINNPATNNSHVLIAVSQSADPTGIWFRYGVRVDEVDGVYAASPSIGLSRDWIVVSANMLDQTAITYFSSDIFTFNRTNLYAGGAVRFKRFFHFPFLADDSAQEAGSPVPVVSMDPVLGTNYVVANAGVVAGVGRLRLMSISGPVDDPVFQDNNQTFYVTPGAAFGSPAWASVSPVNGGFAPQSGTTNKIFIGDARVQNVVYRNGALWAAQHVFLTNGPARTAVQWWCFSPGGTVLQFGRMDDVTGARFYAYPSIAVNRYEDVLLGYSRFAANQFPSANYAFHGYQDGPGQLQGDTVLKAGEARFTVQDAGDVLWGDWSGAAVDPVNEVDMWTIQEYAAAPVAGIERWGTWWGRVSPPTSLGINASGSPGTVIGGSNVVYSIQVTNFSSHVATGVRLVSTLPAGANFISAEVALGACGHTNGVVTCVIGDLPGEVSSNVVVSATIVARLNQGGSATNLISVAGFGPDDLAADNSVAVRTTVTTAADLVLTLAAAPSPVVPANNLTCTLTVTNRGPSSAAGVFVTNVIPAGVTFVSASSSQGSCAQSAGRVSCNVGTLAVNGGASISVVVRPTAAGSLTNSANVVTTALDPNLGNNSVSVVVKASAQPLLQTISNRSTPEDTVLGPVAFTVGDAETPPDNLVVQGFSSNTNLVPHEGIAFGGSGVNRTVTVTPATNASGSVTITRTLADGDGWVVSNSFVLTITAVNDAPSISDVPSQGISEDSVLGPLPFTVGDVETAATSLTMSGASSNPALIPNANITFGGSGASRTVTVRPATNQFGTATITLTVSDGGSTASDTFVVTVDSVNDLPTITDLGNRIINEDSSTPALSFAIGDAETAAAALVVSASSSNPALVSASSFSFGGSGANRTVTVTPVVNQFGSAVITVTVTDESNASRSDTFNLTVNPVNDQPTLAPVPSQSLNEDTALHTINLTGITGGPTNEPQNITINAVSSNPGLIPNPVNVAYTSPNTNATLSFTPTPNSNGTATLTLTLNDGGTSNNILTRVINVTVVAVNDLPVIAGLVDRVINEDTSTGNLAFTVSDVETAAASLTVSGRSSNTNLVPNVVLGGSGANRTVTLSPLPNQNGATTITIFASDGVATNSASFVLTVTPVNDLPSISAVTNRTINEDIATNISFTIGDLETDAASLVLSAISSNPSLISEFSFTGTGTGTNRAVNIIPATNQSGSTTITLSVQDADGGSNSTSFALSVLPVNDPPSLDVITDVVIDEDSPLQTVLLSGIGSGATNEIQALTVTVVSGNTAVVTNVVVVYASASSTGRVEFLPVRNASGTAAVTVFVGDGLATNSRTFNVTVLPINDAPFISAVANVETDEDVTATVQFVIDDLETPAAQLTLQAVSSNTELLDETGISFGGSGTNRTILLTPLPDQSGASTTITITVTDGSNEVAATSFEFSVRPVNDPPSITGLAALTMDEDSGARVVAFAVNDPESLPSSLLVSVASSNPALLPDANVVPGGDGFNRTLTLTPTTNMFGTSIVSVIVRDGAGAGDKSTTNSFVVTVSAVNDPPTIGSIGSLVIAMNAGQQTVNFSGVGMGAGDEGQALSVTAESGNPSLIPTPLVTYTSPSGGGTLTFTPATGAVGLVPIKVTVTESGGVLTGGTNQTSASFTVDIRGSGPPLLIEQLGGQAVVSWSTNNPLNWRLESTTNVSDTLSWAVVPGSPVVVNGRHTVTNALDGQTRFYRLRNE